MRYLDAYEDLLILIDIYRELEHSYKLALYGLRKQCTNPSGCGSIDYSGLPKGKRVNPPTEVVMQKMTEVTFMQNEAKETLMELEKNKENIETYIASLDGTKHKVAYLNVIRNKDIDFISKTLGITPGRVKNLLTEIKKVTPA